MIDILEKINLFCQKIILENRNCNLSSLLDYFSSRFDFLIYYSKPSNNFEVLALNKFYSVKNNFFQIKNLHSKLKKQIEDKIAYDELDELPILFGYHKFPSNNNELLWSDFYYSEWILPQYLLFKKEHRFWLIDFNPAQSKTDKFIIEELFINSKSDFLPIKLKFLNADLFEQWERKVVSAVEKIKQNRLKKIVISLKKEFQILNNVNYSYLIETLNNDYKECFNFLIKSNDSYFFGSSPELLAKFNGSKFISEALAGSIHRGKTVSEDIILSNFLTNDEKNLIEHQLVTEYFKNNLNNKILNITVEEKPKIKKLKNIQHLHSEISGELNPLYDNLDIVKSIFPTPAVCGVPTDIALAELAFLEGFERGIFSGLISWMNFNLHSEFYVGIRCGLIKQNKLNVFAGCGIVNNSNVVVEYNETDLKIRTITELFDVED